MKGENSRSAVAELMTAITALEIAKDLFVNSTTNFSAGKGPRSPSKQATDDGTGETTEQQACRTSDSTYCCAGLGTG